MKKISMMIIVLMAIMILPTIKADAALVMNGSTTYINTNFDAVVYWQVWSPMDGLSPKGSISDYGYYYQVHNSGTGGDNALTQFGVDNPNKLTITGIGYLTTPNLNPLPGSLIAPNPGYYYDSNNCGVWTFTPGATTQNIPLGSDSYLLYFTTPYAPVMVNGGVQAGSYNTQGPVPGPAPEPASLSLLGLSLVGLGGMFRRKFMA